MLLSIRAYVGCVAAAIVLFTASGCKKDEARKDTGATAGSPVLSVRTLKPSEGELATLLPAEIAKAHARNLKTFVELRADWCGPCKELEASMGDPRMVDAFKGTYIVRLDADEWAGKLKALGLESSSIPVFFEVDDAGKATGRKINGGAWAENIPVNMAPPLKKFFSGT